VDGKQYDAKIHKNISPFVKIKNELNSLRIFTFLSNQLSLSCVYYCTTVDEDQILCPPIFASGRNAFQNKIEVQM
jgi:hypothetical protein